MYPVISKPARTLLYWGRKMLCVCTRQYKAFVLAPGCLVVQNGRPHQGEGISKLPLLSFKKVFGDDSNAVSFGSVSAAQRLKLRKKKSFREESRMEAAAMTPKLCEELL